VQKLWGSVVGPLLTDRAGLSQSDLLSSPLECILDYLPEEQGPAATAHHSRASGSPSLSWPSPAAARSPALTNNPRGASQHAVVYQLLYRAQCVLFPPGERDASRQPQALLQVNGRGLVEEDSENIVWDLLYHPRRLSSWRALACFYQDMVDLLLCDAAAAITPSVRTYQSLRGVRSFHSVCETQHPTRAGAHALQGDCMRAFMHAIMCAYHVSCAGLENRQARARTQPTGLCA
jgi:hypothetical protein